MTIAATVATGNPSELDGLMTSSSPPSSGSPGTPSGVHDGNLSNLEDGSGKSSAELLKELQDEKASLEASQDENLSKTNALKLLDQGKNIT